MEFNFTHWIKVFQQNAKQGLSHGEGEAHLTQKEIQTIRDSIRQFQIGESSEGKYLLQAAQRYVQHKQDQSYVDAVILFIREEQRHATMLRQFMDYEGISTIRHHWVDRIFRRLRRFAGLELSIVVLLTAELIAMVYYQALHQATQSQRLRQICERILRDEETHIAFQSYTLHKCWHKRSFVPRLGWNMIRRNLIELTIMVVWFGHQPVLQAGGYTFFSFRRAVMKEYRQSVKLIVTGVEHQPAT